MKKITLLLILLTVSFGYSQELVTNGDFQTGDATGWSGNAANVVTYDMGVTYFNEANVATAGAPYTVNLSNALALTPGSSYTFSFDAWTGAGQNRTMIVGIGRNEPDWQADTVEIDLTETPQNFSYTLVAPAEVTGNDRVIFDMGAAVGYVGIDNVSLVEVVPTCTDGIQNGNETGVDCGGPDCAACPPSCTDGIQNGDETGVDCGGPDCDPCPVPPASAAPTPPARVAGDVVSIFTNGEYADVTPSGVNVFAGASFDNFTIDTADDTRRLTAPNPGGGAQYEFFNASPALDLSGFTHAHVDFYVEGPVAAGQLFQIFLLNFPNYPDGAGATNLNTSFDVNTLGSGTWISGDVELASFGGDLTRDKVALVQVVAAGAPAFGPIYIDNIYFHKNTTLGTEDFAIEGLNVFPNPSNNVWNIKTKDQIIKTVQVFDVLGKQVMNVKPNNSHVELDASTLPKGLYFAKLTTEIGSDSIKLIKN